MLSRMHLLAHLKCATSAARGRLTAKCTQSWRAAMAVSPRAQNTRCRGAPLMATCTP